MILIVDDDASIAASLALLLKQNRHPTAVASSPAQALEMLGRSEFRLVLQDMNFSRGTSGEEGLELLDQIRAAHPDLPIILITAWGSISLAVDGVKRGAADFITKPWTNAQLLSSVETALSLHDARSKTADAPLSRGQLDESFDFGNLIGADPKLLSLLNLVGRIAPTEASVLITGESGTGKELIAEAIHRNSRRHGGPFVKVNLGGISSTLFESEMFGHVRGAFTDARDNRKGRFEVADGGTIFLDEIGEIDVNAQVKLLRVLQDRTYEVLGSSRSRTVDVRVISATNRPLDQLVESGEFREDLLYRLNLITLHLPPLRDRRSDIPMLARPGGPGRPPGGRAARRDERHFADLYGAGYRGGPVEISPPAMQWLRSHSWPGNIRQLKQVIERAILVRETRVLETRDFTGLADTDRRAVKPTDLPAAGTMTLDEMEKAMILKCLHHFEGNVSRVAEALGVSRAALYRRFEKYGLDPGRP